MRKRDRSLLANAASLLLAGVLAGIVVAAAAFPAIAMSGLATKAGADGFGKLPSELNVPTPPQITSVYASDNRTLLATIYDENRHDIPLSEMPLMIRQAIVAAEDQRFYTHHGVDAQGMLRALIANQNGSDRQGASTLTMQYVRQAITYSATSPAEVIAATEDTNARKLREARLSLGLETVLTKDEILERYLNIASFGHGAYGIYAASQVYFNKKPKDLTLAEAALLAGMPKAPSTNDPATAEGKPLALERRAYVLNQMVTLGMVDKATAETAKQSELTIYGKRTPRGCSATPQNHWGFFCDYFYRWWMDQEEFGASPAERESKLKSGGYRVVTTLDVNVQAAAKKNVEKELPTGKSDALMVAAIQPGTGQVKALATNRFFGLDTSKNKPSSDPLKRKQGIKGTYPTTANPILGGGDIRGYKAGSTFKMFTMVAGLEKGYPLDFTIRAVSPYKSQVYTAGVGDAGACKGDSTKWCPRNAEPRLDERQPQHVDRIRQVGQHLLRSAAGEGRRRDRRRRGQAARHPLPEPHRRRIRLEPGQGPQLGTVHDRGGRHRSAGARQLLCDDRGRRRLLRADARWSRSTTTRAMRCRGSATSSASRRSNRRSRGRPPMRAGAPSLTAAASAGATAAPPAITSVTCRDAAPRSPAPSATRSSARPAPPTATGPPTSRSARNNSRSPGPSPIRTWPRNPTETNIRRWRTGPRRTQCETR